MVKDMPAFNKKRYLSRIHLLFHDEGGSFSTIAALSMIILVGMAGAALDFGTAQLARQKLYQAASLACQYAKKTSLVADTASGGAAVRSFFNANLAAQNVTADLVNASFMAVSNGPARLRGNYAVPTNFLGLFNIAFIDVSVDQQCYAAPPQLVAGAEIFKETFETPPLSTETVYNNNPGTTFIPKVSTDGKLLVTAGLCFLV